VELGRAGSASPLVRGADLLDRVSGLIGRWVMWLAAVLVLVQFAVVVARYVYGSSFIWMQESVVYVHALLFMTTIGYTYLRDGHVRVDVLHARWSPRRRAAVELAGILVAVLPFCALLLWASWGYVAVSWRMGEGPMSVGGLPLTPWLKSLIPAMAVLVAIQAIAVALRALAVLGGREGALFPARGREA
jgi:TRAP-type mannitol/chloroaromatic compound transport system permease small subunit